MDEWDDTRSFIICSIPKRGNDLVSCHDCAIPIPIVFRWDGGALVSAWPGELRGQGSVNLKRHERFEKPNGPYRGLKGVLVTKSAEAVVDPVGDLLCVADEGHRAWTTIARQIGGVGVFHHQKATIPNSRHCAFTGNDLLFKTVAAIVQKDIDGADVFQKLPSESGVGLAADVDFKSVFAPAHCIGV
jgi:hypothetical protein